MRSLVYLDDYLDQPDFRLGLRTLAADFRRRAELPLDLDELGLVCPDVVQAADYLQSKYPKMGKFILAEGSAARFDEGGKPLAYRTRVGFAYYQDVLLELAEAGTGSDIFSTHLASDGRITIHHMGYFSRGDQHRLNGHDYAAVLASMGYDQPEWSAKVAAGINVHVAIYDTYAAADNLSLEFLDFRFLGLPIDYPRAAAQALGEFQNSVGPRVLRIPGAGQGLRLQWSLHGSVHLDASPELVWPWLSDPHKLSQWWAGTCTLEKPGPHGSPDEPGAIRRFRATIDGHTIDGQQTITEADAPTLLRYRSPENGVLEQEQGVMTLTQDGSGCKLVWQISFLPEQLGSGEVVVSRGHAWMNQSLQRLATALGGSAVSSQLTAGFCSATIRTPHERGNLIDAGHASLEE